MHWQSEGQDRKDWADGRGSWHELEDVCVLPSPSGPYNMPSLRGLKRENHDPGLHGLM